MAELAPNVPSRAWWQRLRDKHKVKKGAAKVSIGDSIDKVHKVYNKDPHDIPSIAKQMQVLIKDFESYKAAIKKDHADLVSEIDKQIVHGIEQQIKMWHSMGNPSKACADAMRNAVEAVKRIHSKPNTTVLGTEYSGPIRFVGMALTDLMKKPGYEPVKAVRDYWYGCKAVKAFDGGADNIASSTDPDMADKILAVVELLKTDLKHVIDELKKLNIMA
jgi:hypothetical protein